ncbi:MAG: hypothetical protein N3A59_01980 [Thermodesulfovibrionales bacterium]|nr:hypothetical protein [Thermodesulfovibrionales bacterium]
MKISITFKHITLLRSFSILTLILIISSCGGGGGGSLPSIPGENTGVPSVVQLVPSTFIAQTNGFITLNTKVLDGNGKEIPNITVTFTNLSSIGFLNSTVAVTDSAGIARVNVSSTTPGFVTILAQVYTGAGQVRDRKTVYFTTKDTLTVTLDMDVDSVPATLPPNQLSDFTLFENSNDDTIKVTATVRDAGGVPVGGGMSVLWSSSHTEARFIRTDNETNIFGQAEAVVKVEPESIRNTETFVNIAAFAQNGAANMVTLFLKPVVPDPTASYLTANPPVVNVSGTATITAVVMLNTGATAPDGTTVNFSVTCNPNTFPAIVTPFAQTTNGVAQATFIAPPAPAICTVTGKVAGIVIGTVTVTVRAPLSVFPTSMTLNEGDTATFTIFGGVKPYTVLSSNPNVTVSPVTDTPTGGTFTVTVGNVCTPVPPATTCSASVTILVRDAVGTSVTITLTINGT